MKGKLAVLLAGICLLSTSSYAQKNLRALTGFKAPKVVLPNVSSLTNRVTVRIRGAHPSLTVKNLPKRRIFSGTPAAWRAHNPTLARQLDRQGVLVERIPSGKSHTYEFSLDGMTWYEANEMVVKSVQDGQFVRLNADGELRFPLYKDGPEFKFYDRDLFGELKKSKDLGFEIVEQQGYVEIFFPSSVPELRGANPRFVTTVKFLEHPTLFTEYKPAVDGRSGLTVSLDQGGCVGDVYTDAKSITELNNWYGQFLEERREMIKIFHRTMWYQPEIRAMLERTGLLGEVEKLSLVEAETGVNEAKAARYFGKLMMLQSPKPLKSYIQGAENSLRIPPNPSQQLLISLFSRPSLYHFTSMMSSNSLLEHSPHLIVPFRR